MNAISENELFKFVMLAHHQNLERVAFFPS